MTTDAKDTAVAQMAQYRLQEHITDTKDQYRPL